MKYALLVLTIAAALLVSGCCSGCSLFDPDTSRVIFADDLENPADNSTAYGVWSSTGASVVDPAVFPNADDGEWYMLNEKGYFKHVKISTENGAKGGIYREGRLSFDDDRLLLSGINESYYPGTNSRISAYSRKSVDDESFNYELLDNYTLAIGSGTYHRIF
jgi:hypothetical protein